MNFDPTRIDEDGVGEGHLDETPVHAILLSVQRTGATGRLTIEDAAGQNHMYFMRGQPVGVQLAEFHHPLGQLLLELGRIDASIFLKAQRLISEGNRLPGQVFKEIDVLDDAALKEVLAVQSRRKAAQFCRFGSRAFLFGRGLSFLSGFNATPLDIHAVIYLAVRQQMGPSSREALLESLAGKEIHSPFSPEQPLPAPLKEFEFGPPEERFLRRVCSGWQSVNDLKETGTLPAEDMAVMLRFLQLIGRLDVREPAGAPAEVSIPRKAPTAEAQTDVFSSSPDGDAPSVPSPRLRTHTETTDPRGDIHNVPTDTGNVEPRVAAKNQAPSVQSGKSLLTASDDEAAPRPKKKKRRRRIPLPSEGSSAMSVPRKEKTTVSPLPSIVIED